jgi:hypothetical protein
MYDQVYYYIFVAVVADLKKLIFYCMDIISDFSSAHFIFEVFVLVKEISINVVKGTVVSV